MAEVDALKKLWGYDFHIAPPLKQHRAALSYARERTEDPSPPGIAIYMGVWFVFWRQEESCFVKPPGVSHFRSSTPLGNADWHPMGQTLVTHEVFDRDYKVLFEPGKFPD